MLPSASPPAPPFPPLPTIPSSPTTPLLLLPPVPAAQLALLPTSTAAWAEPDWSQERTEWAVRAAGARRAVTGARDAWYSTMRGARGSGTRCAMRAGSRRMSGADARARCAIAGRSATGDALYDQHAALDVQRPVTHAAAVRAGVPEPSGQPPLDVQRPHHWRHIRGEEYKSVTPHTFRRTVATMVERTYGAEHAAKQLGH